jgi:hypothetical protein
MATKYIVNNVSGQTINGDLTINGNVTISGTSTTNSVGTYRALMTQTGELEGDAISWFNYALIIGETYTINTYFEGDDFSNIADVTSGVINQTGCVFIATGTTPNIWENGTDLSSDGGLIVDVLENTLGYDINWSWVPFGGIGYYIGVKDTQVPLINSFPKNKVSITTQATSSFVTESIGINIYSNTVNIEWGNDSAIQIIVVDYFYEGFRNNSLYYTPIEIKINQDLDTTPILVYSETVNNFPYYYVGINLYAGDNNVGTFYTATSTLVGNITEMVADLNSSPTTNFLGTFSVNEGVENGIILTMATNLKNQFSPNNTLTFGVFDGV